jgi:[calcium/calmodulin-dependent protein kinase] kinase
MRQEIAIMKKLKHPNVLRLFEVIDAPDANELYLILEYMRKGDLLTQRGDGGAFDSLDGDEWMDSGASASSNSNSGRGQGEPDSTEQRKPLYMCRPMQEQRLWFVCRQVVSGLCYLKQEEIVHGDIKPQNLLVGEDGAVKIADFGISTMLAEDDETEASGAEEGSSSSDSSAVPAGGAGTSPKHGGGRVKKKNSIVSTGGSPLFMAPEVVAGQAHQVPVL